MKKTAPLRETVVTETVLNAIDDLQLMEDLEQVLMLEELDKAFDSLSTGKVPGSNGIPPEVIKSGKSALMQPLHNVLHFMSVFEGRCFSQEMGDAFAVTVIATEEFCS